MRRIFALLAVMVMVQFAAGCRHVGGACDCDHASGSGAARRGGCTSCGGGVAGPVAPVGVLPAGPAPYAPMPR